MNKLEFSVYICGMSEETFSEEIMIYKPVNCVIKYFTEVELRQCHIIYISELIDHLKNDAEVKSALGVWGLKNISISTVYVQDNKWLLGLRQDKLISEMFCDFETDRLRFACFIAGGASIHNNTGYRFTVHPDEDIHRHMPHVHVLKAGVQIRYSLDTLLPIDKLVDPHKRDNKKLLFRFCMHTASSLLKCGTVIWKDIQRRYLLRMADNTTVSREAAPNSTTG